MKLSKFIPLTKMEEQADGTLHVFGLVTAEQPDLENEVCDYDGTKPYYKAKVEEMQKATTIEGMTPSIMPLREMHQLKAIGAGRSIEFDDANKTIRMGFEVVDPVAITKFKKGVLIGFSQGGSYVGELLPDPAFKGCKRYVCDPGEVSGVDSPCLPIALLQSMKGRTVQLAKVDGVTENIPLEIKSVDTQISTLFASAGAVKAALTCGDQPKEARVLILAAAEKHGVKIDSRDELAIKRACANLHANRTLGKGLYEVGWLGDVVEQLHWLCLQSEFERDMEDDGSKVPEGLREAWLALIAEFKAMAVEEADELAAQAPKGEKGMKIKNQEGLTKAAKSLHDHLEGLKEKHEAMGEHLTKAHEAQMKKHEAMGEHIEKCMKACKDAMDGEEPEEHEKAASADVTKALEPVLAELAALKSKLAAIPAPGAPHTGAVDLSKKAPEGSFDSLLTPAVTH